MILSVAAFFTCVLTKNVKAKQRNTSAQTRAGTEGIRATKSGDEVEKYHAWANITLATSTPHVKYVVAFARSVATSSSNFRCLSTTACNS